VQGKHVWLSDTAAQQQHVVKSIVFVTGTKSHSPSQLTWQKFWSILCIDMTHAAQQQMQADYSSVEQKMYDVCT